MRMRYLIVSLMLLALTACSDSPEHKLGQAVIALRNGQAGEALRLADEVLQERPGDHDATMIKARSHLRLRQYDLSQATFRTLIKQDPSDEQIYRELLDLALAHMSDLLAKTEFTADAKLGERFTQAKLLGHEQADWFATHRPDSVESDFARARLILLDAQRIQRYVTEEVDRLRTEHVADPTKPLTNPSVEEQRRQVESMRLSAEQYLQRIVTEMPGHPSAAAMLTGLLTQREAWSELWVLGQSLALQKDLKASLVTDIGNAILRIPETRQTNRQRLDLVGKLVEAVSPVERQSPSWRLTKARYLLLEGEVDEAHQIAQDLMRIQPNDVDTRFVMARCLYLHRKFELAKTILSALAIDAKENPLVQSLYGLTLVQLGDETAAVEVLRHAIQLNPNDHAARSALIQVLNRQRGSTASAIEHINTLYQANPQDPDAIRFKFTAEIANGNEATIAELMDKVKRISPLKSGHYRVLTDGSVYLRKFDDALKWAKACVEADAAPANYLGLARVHLIRQESGPARQVLDEAKAKFPESPQIDLSLASLYLNQGEHDRAIKLLNGILSESPEDVDARIMLARAYSRLSMTEQALDEVNVVLQNDPTDPRALEMAASVYRIMGQEELAKSYLEKIDESLLDEERHAGIIARLRLARGQTTEALAVCQRAIAAGNSDPLIRLTIASIHASTQNIGEEEVHLLAFVRENPNNLIGYQMLAGFYTRNNVERGLNAFASMRSQNDTLARLGQAILLNATGRKSDAIRLLAEGYPYVLKANHPIALSYARGLAGMILAERRNAVDSVIPLYEALIKSNLYVAEARLAILDLTWNQVTPKDRVATLDRIVDELPASSLLKINSILERFARSGATDRALAAVERLAARIPDNYLVLMARGDALRANHRLQDAIGSYEAARDLRPESPGAYERLIDVHMEKNEFVKAEQLCDAMAAAGVGARIRGLWKKADMFAELGLHAASMRVLDELSKVTSTDDPRVNYAIGACLLELGNPDDAHRRLAIIPAYAPQYGPAQLLVAGTEENRGASKGAKRRLEKLWEDGRHANDAARMMMEIAVRNQDNDQLLKWSESALQVNRLTSSSRAKWLALRAFAQANSGDLPGVERTLGELATVNQAPSVRAARILVLALQGKQELARSALELDRQVKLSDHGALLSIGLGLEIPQQAHASQLTQYMAALVKGDPASAKSAITGFTAKNNTIYAADLRRALESSGPDGTDAQVYRQLALAVVAIECDFPALCDQIVTPVLAKHPKLALGYGLALASRIKTGKPLDEIQTAVRTHLNGSCIEAFLAVHENTQARKWSDAIAAANRIIEQEPENDYVIYRLITLYKLSRETDKAAALLRKLADKNGPFRDVARNDLAYHLASSDSAQLDEARQIATELRKANPLDPNVADTLGWIEHLMGNHAEALKHLSFSVSKMKSSADVQFHLGVVLKALGNDVWARRHLEAAVAAKSEPVSSQASALLKGLQ